MRLLLGLGRVALGALFVYAAIGKLGDLRLFAEEVANYQLLPPRVVPLVAATLPGIELLAGALLVLGVRARAAALVVGGMLLVFTVALSLSLSRHVDLRCGCFGSSDPATWWTVVRDGVLLVVAAAVVALGEGALSAEAWARSRRAAA